jgi:hypothetical protein
MMERWIVQMFQQLPAQADIIGVIWFEGVSVIDWQVADNPAAAAAFRAGLDSNLYRVGWRLGMRPLLRVPARSTAASGRRPAPLSAASGHAATSLSAAATSSHRNGVGL